MNTNKNIETVAKPSMANQVSPNGSGTNTFKQPLKQPFKQSFKQSFNPNTGSDNGSTISNEKEKEYKQESLEIFNKFTKPEMTQVTNFIQLIAVYMMAFNHVQVNDKNYGTLSHYDIMQRAYFSIKNGKTEFPEKQYDITALNQFFCNSSETRLHGRSIDVATFQ